ncbi:MAG TPA: NADH-quinone oxidoreductase subunit M [Candidatus Hydrogenedentes bacterium]|nr:NADH-quinone oxidoreductase subunit M [Candidatus Hydrogenedentota bacterium]HOV72799.1 NADH-quinone oxidoreductase subunit M [Candidatus Hydrogenedentota bacterium]HPC17692.1 NADH-quinone oxidoreductase subunit M [Candidatus Hydrogenedentota bacterium]HRT21317.1 NADH-quinone oxidoreductase subunit M [Candidatus Hydrogenedentota bacterium]HRT65482.1 NADH-quinone oxidoreductase subunit M [Candidatus Hydrogenedentota bacterium]
MDKSLLTLITFLPLAGAVVMLLAPNGRPGLIRAIAAATTGIVFLLTLYLWWIFDAAAIKTGGALAAYDARTLIEIPWITAYNIYYRLGVDGLSVMLIVLTGLLSFLATFSAFSVVKQVKAFYVLYMLLVTGMMGVFMALDFFLFYVFWEVMLLPMYFLIGIWGGPRKEYAAIKFFIYTLLGSVLILLVMLAYYFKMSSMGQAQYAFNIPELVARQPFHVAGGPTLFQYLLFWGLFIGFAIKVPIFPFHTWLPDAHVEAPTAISVILAGVLLKMGGYGFLRLNWPLLPDVASMPGVMWFLAVLGVVNIIYGALCALGQSDFKRLVAYSSVSHMGYVLLGIAILKTEAVNGAIFQMFAHGLSSAMMFMLVGVIYDRAHHRDIARLGGLGTHMPVYFALAVVGFFASLGLPSLVGFIGEVMVLLGTFRYSPWLAACSTVGLLLTAGYILWTMQRVYLGKAKPEYEGYPDCNRWEFIAIAPLGVLCIVFGILPMLVLNVYASSTDVFMRLFVAL